MEEYDALAVLKQLISPKHENIVAQQIIDVNNDALTLEAIADDLLRKVYVGNQTETIQQYIKAKKAFEQQKDEHSVNRVMKKLESLADECVQQDFWQQDFGGFTRGADIIAAYSEANAADKIRAFGKKALESHHEHVAREAFKAIGEELLSEDEQDSIIKSILNGDKHCYLKFSHLKKSKAFYDEFGTQLLKKTKEAAKDKFRAIINHSLMVMATSYLQNHAEVMPDADSLTDLIGGDLIIEFLQENKKKNPGLYPHLNDIFVNSIKEWTAADEGKHLDRKSAYQNKMSETRKRLKKLAEKEIDLCELIRKFDEKHLSGMDLALLIKEYNKLDGEEVGTKVSDLFHSASVAFQKSENYEKMMELAELQERSGRVLGYVGALSTYEFLNMLDVKGAKEKMKQISRDYVDKHIKRFEKSKAQFNEEVYRDKRYVNIKVTEMLEKIKDDEYLKKIANFYISKGFYLRALSIYENLGQLPSKGKVRIMAKACLDNGLIHDYMHLMKEAKEPVDTYKVLKGIDIAIEKERASDAIDALVDLRLNVKNKKQLGDVIKKEIKLADLLLARGDYKGALDAVGWGRTEDELRMITRSLEMAIENKDHNIFSNCESLVFPKKDPTKQRNLNVMNFQEYTPMLPLTDKMKELFDKAANLAMEEGHYYHVHGFFKLAGNRKGSLKLARTLLEKNEYEDFFRLYRKLNIPKKKANAEIGKYMREKVINNLKKDIYQGLEFLIDCASKPELKDLFKIQLSKEKQEEGHLADVSKISLSSAELLDANIVIKIEDLPPGKKLTKAEIEARIYAELKREGISCPEYLKNGVIDNRSVQIIQYIPYKSMANFEISKEILYQIVGLTGQIHDVLNRELSQLEKKELTEDGFGKQEFYVTKIVNRFKDKMGVELNPEALNSLDTYLVKPEVQKQSVIISDRNPTNILYDKGSKNMTVIDFNAARVSLPQEDWAFFIDDPRLKTSMTRDEMIKAYATSQEEITTFHYIATYRNLIQTAMRWVDEPKNKQISYHNLQRAKESAKKIGLTKLIEEIEQKIEPTYTGS